MKFLKYFSTKVRRVFIADTDWVLVYEGDPFRMRWYNIQVKLFGKWWVTIKSYEHLWFEY